MLVNIVRRTAFLSLFLFVTACSDILDGPTEEDIATQLAFELPAGVEVDSVEIIVSENVGSEVEPRYRNRSKATLSLTEDRVELADTYDDKFIVRKVMDGGVEFDVTLITTAALANEKWKIKLDKLEGRQITGSPIGQFVEGTYAYEGTDEEAQIIEAYEAKVEAEKLAAQEEARRQYAEAEAARAKALADQVARVAAFREFMAGTWVSIAPVTRNKDIYQTRSGDTASVELNFEEGKGATGKVKVKLFVTDDVADEIILNANFRVADSGEFATLYLNSRADHRTLNWSFRENWTFNKQGLFETGRRTRWQAEMTNEATAIATKRAEEQRVAKRSAAITALLTKHRAFNGNKRLTDIGLKRNSYGPVFVDAEKAQTGDVFGDVAESYGEYSSVVSAAIHAGVLKQGESGVLKVSRRVLSRRNNISGTLRNGIQSKNFNRYDVYKIELIEKLEVN